MNCRNVHGVATFIFQPFMVPTKGQFLLFIMSSGMFPSKLLWSIT